MAEPLRLAQFLRERCARKKYGLRYLNSEQTLLLIPWPVVPRPNEEPPPGFQMFHEWAEQSHRRRGNSEAPELRESATQQKHRFRNALARANGIVYRKDINFEGARVYEFVDSRKPQNSSDVPSPYDKDVSDDLCDDTVDFINQTSPDFTLSPDPYCAYSQSAPQNALQVNEFNQGQVNEFNQGYYHVPYNHPENTAVNPVLSPTHSASSQPRTSGSMNGITQYNILPNTSNYEWMDLLTNTSPQAEEQSRPLGTDGQIVGPGPSNVNQIPASPEKAPPELEIHVRFRQDDALQKTVSNRFGCRVYYGKNIPDISLLLEKEHLQNIMSKFRFDKEIYYGPESFQQVQLPRPDNFMRNPVQSEKTVAILQNMDRGLLLFLEYANASLQSNVPDVYAMRLCQTRIFPCYKQAGQPNTTEGNTLKRMEWTKVFDGKVFHEQLLAADQEMSNGMENYPSPSFSFSLGQKPSGEEKTHLLVCLTVTVQRAQQLIQSRLDSEREEICISYLNSTDVEARNLAKRLTETLTL